MPSVPESRGREAPARVREMPGAARGVRCVHRGDAGDGPERCVSGSGVQAPTIRNPRAPPGGAGPLLCKSVRLAPGRRSGKPVKNYCKLRAAGKSTSCWLVWRLDRWGRSVTDLLSSLQELEHLGVGFVSLTEALDLTTPAGRAMAGLLAIFADMRSSKRKFCGNELARDWRTPGRTASAWAGPQPLRCTPRRSGNCIAQASAKPKSTASSGLGALPSAESWAIPPRNRSARLRYAGLPKAHDVVVRSHSDMSLANQDYICQTDGLR